jgi:enoyl-CoA hydratase/carnithine racemase
MPDEIVSVEIADHIGVVRMQRVEKHNAFSRALDTAVADALSSFDGNADVHCAILTGTGRAFSAGADMSEAVEAIDGKGRSEGMARTYGAVASFRKPLIAAVNGLCYGGGALVSILCDIRIASDDAAFRFPGAAYGLVVGGAQLPRIVGPAYAKELLFTTKVVQADEALRIGLVNHVVPREEIDEFVMDMARQIAANSPTALMATKNTVDRASEIDAGTTAEGAHNAELRTSPEHHERFKAAAGRVASRPPKA